MFAHGPEGTAQVFWRRSRFWLLVVSNPLWIALTAPARWLLDQASGFGHRGWRLRHRHRRPAVPGGRVPGARHPAPGPRMAGRARHSGLEAEVAAFEAWDPAGRVFDAVIAGQAWHWADPAAGAVKAAQVLRPGGRLAVFWNAFQPPPGLGQAVARVHHQVLPGAPSLWAGPLLDAYLTLCGTAAGGICQAGAFGDPQQWRTGWDRRYTRSQWLDQVPTLGGHTQLPPATLDGLLAGIGAAGGSFTMHCTTVAATAARLTSP
jgi:SAM-dependent methyltransferase